MIRFERVHPDARLPAKAHPADAAFDLACVRHHRIGPHFGPTPIRTGLRAAIPPGWCCRIVGRSGLGGRGVIVHGGIIDSGYTGEWIVILSSIGDTIEFAPGDRIAQFLVLPVPAATVEWGEVNTDTERGPRGLGSTGR